MFFRIRRFLDESHQYIMKTKRKKPKTIGKYIEYFLIIYLKNMFLFKGHISKPLQKNEKGLSRHCAYSPDNFVFNELTVTAVLES